jgi:hypothetical protein
MFRNPTAACLLFTVGLVAYLISLMLLVVNSFWFILGMAAGVVLTAASTYVYSEVGESDGS